MNNHIIGNRSRAPVISCLLLVVGMALSSGDRAQEQERSISSLFSAIAFGYGQCRTLSNGPVWVEQLAESLKLPLRASEGGGQNFAVGGARIKVGPKSLRAQVDQTLKLPRPAGHTLYIVWGGANDIFAAIGQPDARSELDAAAAALKEVLTELMAYGGLDFLVPNIPELGITPEVRAHGSEAIERRAGSPITSTGLSNGGLLICRLSGRHWALSPRCCCDGRTSAKRSCELWLHQHQHSMPGDSRCAKYVFWDNIHPTTAAHARLAEAALDASPVRSSGLHQTWPSSAAPLCGVRRSGALG